jgi:hypothetical protein
MTAPRLPDWPARLMRFLSEQRAAPFAWGTADCCTLAADAVLALTGRDPMAAYRGRYRSETGARRLLARHGGLEGLLRHVLGEPMANPKLAQRGDVGLAAAGAEGAPICCVVTSQGLACRQPGAGLVFLPRGGLTVAWRI